jgi:hypothetical protein
MQQQQHGCMNAAGRMTMELVHCRREKKAPAKQFKTFNEISTLAAVEEEAQPDPLSAANMVCSLC